MALLYVAKMFSVFFMATRDIKMSVLLVLLFFIFIKFFIDESSTFCLVKTPSPSKKNVTKDDYEKAKQIIEEYNKTINA